MGVVGVVGFENLIPAVYGCFVEKANCRNLSFKWILKGKEIVVQGADVYDEVHTVAFGNSPEELLVWARVHGFDIARNQEL